MTADREGPAIVAFGGGHGLAVTLSALTQVTDRLTAVVTVADDGGSSGRLRAEFPGLLPPGDLRMALAALAGTDAGGADWAAAMQHRFPGDGPLGGHAVGNLLLAGLADAFGDPVAALDAVGRLVRARGRVLPLAPLPLDIEADVALPDGTDAVVRGQHAVAVTQGAVRAVRLVPAAPPGCAEAMAAVRAADWIVLGPGSLFSSVVPHLLVPDVRTAVLESQARAVYVLNLVPQPGETSGFSPARHLEVLLSHADWLPLAAVVADEHALEVSGGRADLERVAHEAGARVVTDALAVPGEEARHDPSRLATALRATVAGPPLLPTTARRTADSGVFPATSAP
ncbi:MAG TPA: uridine diphosphate-N-acetylglucosamine-binding protein YvcK [Mycobacteriales bacterium]|nr:uridine diphosphate-N-acetylglucosamine-binding protein YvcK [Mycobacteriales bacterium]